MKSARWALRTWAWTDGVLIWLLVLIATPISVWVAGDQVFPLVASLGVLAQFSVVILAVAGAWSKPKLLAVAAFSMIFTWLAEWAGSQTGFPFGYYQYSHLLQPQFGGVPLLIPLAWLMMLLPAWAVTEIILEPWRSRFARAAYQLAYAGLSGLVFTAWDLFLDPQMVGKGLWIWEQPGGYFGIPWLNYFGWWLVSSFLTLLVRWLNGGWQAAVFVGSPASQRLFLVYTLTWVFQAIGLGIFWGQPGPALVGFLVMGLFVLLAWRREKPTWRF